MLIQIAWRNVWRNKTRSLVIISAVALGLWGGIFSDAFMQGMAEQQIYSAIHTETGHIQLNRPGFLLNHDMQARIENSDSLAKKIEKIPGVAAVEASTQVTAMASTASGSTGIMLNGIDPVRQQQVSDLHKQVVKGDFFRSGRSNQVVIGQQLADKLKTKLHSRIVLTLQTIHGEIIYGAFSVSGIFRTNDADFDKQMAFVGDKDLQALTNFPPGAASVITVLLQNTKDTKLVTTILRQEFPALQVQSWENLSPMLQVTSAVMQKFTFIFVGIILVALAFGIINTMLMAVMDRTREIGMLLSIGMKPSKVFGMIILETLFLSLTGAIAGITLSLASISWFGQRGINLSMIAEGANALGYSSIVYPTLGMIFYIELAFMVMVIAVIAGLFPAKRAIRLRPAEAIRGE